ncbi:lycopene cyclase family protein, partial [Dermatophilus congolensis]|uniref:lycopene cyclase family protein n=3 Tax=Dermatophilus congolensis TaxID=1863 RepID=UPI001FBA1A35
DADAVLMDWRPHDGTPTWGHRTASFCYTIPLPNGRILTEETILAATPPIPTTHLAQRLHTRLARHGIHPDPTSTTEHVHIPMLPTTPHHRHPRFGAASHQNNPLTGYSVFASLAAADTAAHTLIHHGHLPPAPPATTIIRRLALNALTRLNGHHTFNLFDAYNHLPAHKQRAIMDPTTNAPTLLNALTTQWANLPPHTRATLIAATTNLTPRHHQDTPRHHQDTPRHHQDTPRHHQDTP